MCDNTDFYSASTGTVSSPDNFDVKHESACFWSTALFLRQKPGSEIDFKWGLLHPSKSFFQSIKGRELALKSVGILDFMVQSSSPDENEREQEAWNDILLKVLIPQLIFRGKKN